MARKSRDLRVTVGEPLTAHQVKQIEGIQRECHDLAVEANRWREEAHRLATQRTKLGRFGDRLVAALQGK